jgi:ribonuclease P protein component
VLSLPNRLKSRRDFDRIFKKGHVVSGPLFIIRGVPNGLTVSRVGFAVSTKIDKRAVVRNRIRRRLREIFRVELLPRFVGGYDLVVIVKPAAAKALFADLRASAERLARQAGMFKDAK